MSIQSRNKPNAEFSLASIADIVFLLLIFFMLTSSFVNQAGVEIKMPQSASSTPSKGKSSVTITADGEYYWNANKVAKSAIPGKIEQVLTDQNKDNDVVTLRVDKRVTYEASTVVISNVAKHQGTLVIATKKDE
jgi:biopolymer transport protein ExbD